MRRWSCALIVVTIWSAGQMGNAVAAGGRPFDLDGDGRQDLVAGMPLNGPRGSGAVAVRLSRSGARWRVLSQSTRGVPGGPQTGNRPQHVGSTGDRFGVRVASGDFDADGYADLAIGASREQFAAKGAEVGSVTVLRGSPQGVTTRGAVRFRGPTTLTPRVPVRFGGALVAGDLDSDGYADLVVGALGEDSQSPELRVDVREPPGLHGSGAIHLLFGGPSGLSEDRARTLARPGIADWEFGALLAVADVNRDGHLDVIEGAQGQPQANEPGQSAICPGQPSGPTTCLPFGPSTTAGPTSLAIGDVDGDSYLDVVQGVAVGQLWGGRKNAPPGVVRIWRGGSTGLAPEPIAITRDTAGVPGVRRVEDGFGKCVSAGDLDHDGYDDVVAATQFADTGALVLVRGAATGHAPRGNSAYTASSFALHRNAFTLEGTMAMLDRDGDGRGELVVQAITPRVELDDPDRRVSLIAPRSTRRGLVTGRAESMPLPRLNRQKPPDVGALARADSSGCIG